MIQTFALIRKLKRGFRTIRRRLFLLMDMERVLFCGHSVEHPRRLKLRQGNFPPKCHINVRQGHRPLYSGYSFNPRLRGSRFVPPVMSVTHWVSPKRFAKENHASSGFLEVVFKFKYLSEHRCTQIKISKRDDSGGSALLVSSMSFRIQDFDLA